MNGFCLYQEKMCVYCPHMSSPLTFTDPYPLTSHARPHLSPLSQAARHTMPAWITSNGPAGPVQGPPPITWKPWSGCPWWPWWPRRGFYLTEWITLNNPGWNIRGAPVPLHFISTKLGPYPSLLQNEQPPSKTPNYKMKTQGPGAST